MIKIINNVINNFIMFLNQNYGIEQTVYIHIAENCDSIQTPDGGVGFGVFDNTTDNIYVACDYEFMDDRSILTTIAHEYKHFLQKYDDGIYSEEDADNFAIKVYEEFMETIS